MVDYMTSISLVISTLFQRRFNVELLVDVVLRSFNVRNVPNVDLVCIFNLFSTLTRRIEGDLKRRSSILVNNVYILFVYCSLR